MKLTATIPIACIVAGAAAFEYPDFVPLQKRQAPGTPQYDCHANCGGIITLSRSDGYCDTDEFTTKLSDCLDCALEYDIWKWYGNSVSKAADECGVDATPVEPTTSSSSAASATATETETEEPSSTTETSEESTSVPEETATGSTTLSSTPVIPTGTATTTPTFSESSVAGTPTPADPEFTGGAISNGPAALVLVGLMGPLVAALM
ncbi:uncharacterized protein BDV14DRAFT_152740 [Aspergillus stella-maris]|uniref:uncharacterized protein n=1 Tax=Aspergillus stella-maris TaxID=1810926 RepID=UPI003CCD354F